MVGLRFKNNLKCKSPNCRNGAELKCLYFAWQYLNYRCGARFWSESLSAVSITPTSCSSGALSCRVVLYQHENLLVKMRKWCIINRREDEGGAKGRWRGWKEVKEREMKQWYWSSFFCSGKWHMLATTSSYLTIVYVGLKKNTIFILFLNFHKKEQKSVSPLRLGYFLAFSCTVQKVLGWSRTSITMALGVLRLPCAIWTLWHAMAQSTCFVQMAFLCSATGLKTFFRQSHRKTTTRALWSIKHCVHCCN